MANEEGWQREEWGGVEGREEEGEEPAGIGGELTGGGGGGGRLVTCPIFDAAAIRQK